MFLVPAAVYIAGGQRVRFAHNTVVGGECSLCGSAAILQLSEVVSTITNRVLGAAPAAYNNLFVSRSPQSDGFYLGAAYAAPKSVLSNVFVSVNDALDPLSGPTLSVSDINSGSLPDVCIGSPFTFDNSCMSSGASFQSAQGGGNATSSLTLSQLFMDIDGADNLLGTLDDDYRLLTNDASITDGGLDTSLSDCGYVGEGLPCGDITTDIIGTPRDATPSVGAYEKM